MNYDEVLTTPTLKLYLKNNINHRIDGPAVEHNDGHQEFWYEGKYYMFESYLQEIKSIVPAKEYVRIVLKYTR